MSETWSATRTSLRRLRAAWEVSDEDSRYRFVFYFTGIALAGAAIVLQFGWIGALFCTGMVFCAAGSSKPS